MPTLSAIEDGCDRKEVTLVVHPAIRNAIKDYEDSFYVGMRCFLAGESDGLFFLPLQTRGYVRPPTVLKALLSRRIRDP